MHNQTLDSMLFQSIVDTIVYRSPRGRRLLAGLKSTRQRQVLVLLCLSLAAATRENISDASEPPRHNAGYYLTSLLVYPVDCWFFYPLLPVNWVVEHFYWFWKNNFFGNFVSDFYLFFAWIHCLIIGSLQPVAKYMLFDN